MKFDEFNKDYKNFEPSLDKIIANQKKMIWLLSANALLLFGLIIIKLFVTG